MFLSNWIDRVGDWNPQLFRELKGRLTPKSLALMALVSGITQGMIYFSFFSGLPYRGENTSHYCLGTAPASIHPDNYLYSSNNWCLRDALKQVTTLNWPLWWTEMFVVIALLGFALVLIGGTYLLIQDLSKEQQQGTLNFVTLTPQAALSIALGKILGVPTFIYGMVVFALPLHLVAGLKGGIPIYLIALFYVTVAGAWLFIFSGAILYALIGKGGGAVKSWAASGALAYFTLLSTLFIVHESAHASNVTDAILLLNPTHLMHYLVQASPAFPQMDWFNYDSLGEISFYGVALWKSVFGATLAHLTVYGVGIYWWGQAFKRKFHNATGTLISKSQSYWLTASLVTFCLGFTTQTPLYFYADENNWLINFGVLAIAGSFYILLLVMALSPSFQSIQDWSRYRNQRQLKDWLFSERSPANGAIIVNVMIGILPMIGVGLILMERRYYLSFISGMVFQGLMTIVLATVGIFMLMIRHRKRGVFATVTVSACIFLPLVFFAITVANPEYTAGMWLWSISPVFVTQFAGLTTIIGNGIGQLAAIALLNRMVQHRVKEIGKSELKQLMGNLPKATI